MFPASISNHLSSPQKILILTAIPKGLRLGLEVREIEEAIRRSIQRDRYSISVRTALRPKDLRRVIAEDQPNIVHFCGHGLANGCLLLEDDAGRSKPITPASLASLFKLHSQYVYCVILNACHSEKAAAAISQHISYAIGMNQSIQNDAAIAYAQGFYDAIGYGSLDNSQLIERAFQEGKVAVQLDGITGHIAPVLKCKSHNPISIVKPLTPERVDTPSLEIPANETSPSKTYKITSRSYSKLRQYLENANWKAANEETFNILLAIAKRDAEGWLRSHDIENIPCSDLKRIDHLWCKFSLGKFGLSVQRDIWLAQISSSSDFNGSLFRAFGHFVGWRVGESWLTYKDLNFSLEAPAGHFPIMRSSYGDGQSNWFGSWRDNFNEFIHLSSKCL
ncbi:GUN4 domain-containing protein [Acaryochloris sp. 'Moss Beach']|uniref:GUN4 domain-containing protein n=1 Tax=Acaryochloris sp. 'Moss Beach' TaxID=2740837 RepID=UPI001F282520|nr:GUN4 domain-containing protein [Acaryochloris sp. 'Moss Beach']UJB68977.1 GUN4 domain-containing protein [Acaryochloris sp. 'Moss Beach']